MKVKTVLGEIISSESNGGVNEGKGVWIELYRPDALTSMTIAFIEIDETSNETKLVTRVWSDGMNCDYTDKIVHKNVEEFFKNWQEF